MQLTHFFRLLLCLNICDGKKYNQYKLYRGTPINDAHLDFFTNISSRYEVNFWKNPGQLYMPIEFTISPDDVEAFVKEADSKGIYLTTILKDVQEAFDNQTVRIYVRRKMDSFDFQSYFRLRDIYSWMEDLAKEFPGELTVFSIGNTVQKRRILAVKLVHKESQRRSSVIVEGGIHAREWISHAFVTYLLNELVHARTSDNKRLRDIAFTYEWYFIPVANPDGYEYTHQKDRLWRKNLRGGYGVDLNRNFDSAFGSVGVSFMRNSEQYCGDKSFSEPESDAMRAFIRQKSQNLEYYVSFHAYGQLFIIPYAYTKKHRDNYDEMERLGNIVTAKIARRSGTRYTVGTAYDTVGYMAAGTSTCWVKEKFRVPYVATLELRDKGDFGFALPPKLILPTCQETMDGVIELFQPNQQMLLKLPNGTPKTHEHFLEVLVIILLFVVQ